MAGTGWFIYAMGSGWGHLNRALALARVAVQQRPVQLLTNSPYLEQLRPQLQQPSLTLHSLHSVKSLAVARQQVQEILARAEYNTLVVDTFPRGLIGELADIIPNQSDLCRVLIHRDLAPHYIKAKAIEPFVRSHYEGLLLPGEPNVPLAHLEQAKLTEPWLSRCDTELSDPTAMRSRYNLPSSTPLIVVCATGLPTELAFFGQVSEQLANTFPSATIRCLSAVCPPGCHPNHWISHWPGIDILQLADVVVGSGGYNLVHECAALAIPLIAFAQKRRYDRQSRRIRAKAIAVKTIDDAIAVLAPIIEEKRTAHRASPRYANGIVSATKHIENWQLF